MTTAMKRHKERKMMVRGNAALADRVAELEAENTRLHTVEAHAACDTGEAYPNRLRCPVNALAAENTRLKEDRGALLVMLATLANAVDLWAQKWMPYPPGSAAGDHWDRAVAPALRTALREGPRIRDAPPASDNASLRKLCGCGSGEPAGACSFGCQRCGGSGRVGDAPCEACHASGNRPALRSGALRLPEGADDHGS